MDRFYLCADCIALSDTVLFLLFIVNIRGNSGNNKVSSSYKYIFKFQFLGFMDSPLNQVNIFLSKKIFKDLIYNQQINDIFTVLYFELQCVLLPTLLEFDFCVLFSSSSSYESNSVV